MGIKQDRQTQLVHLLLEQADYISSEEAALSLAVSKWGNNFIRKRSRLSPSL